MSIQETNSLIAKGLHKKYGSRMVVNNVDISVSRNEIVGLLGPNGAGKTTTFYMITGMIKPTKGDIGKGKNYIAENLRNYAKVQTGGNLTYGGKTSDNSRQERSRGPDGSDDDSDKENGRRRSI